jgi:hypothetical protein
MIYPNRVVKKGEADANIVTAIQTKLSLEHCGPITIDGIFGTQTESAVKLFQTRNFDLSRTPLTQDGEVGPITWAALFGDTTVINNNSLPSSLLTSALITAISQINVVEVPRGSNRGPQVDKYLNRVGIDPGTGSYAWCAAFVYYCFDEAAKNLSLPNPLPKTAGVLKLWSNANCLKIRQADALGNPALISAGDIFIIDHGAGLGHTGIVESVNGGNMVTIEGNTNDGLSRNGYGVFRQTKRKLSHINVGFLHFS